MKHINAPSFSFFELNSEWGVATAKLEPMQRLVADIPLDTVVEVALRSGVAIRGEVEETPHPRLLCLRNPRSGDSIAPTLIPMVMIETNDIIAVAIVEEKP